MISAEAAPQSERIDDNPAAAGSAALSVGKRRLGKVSVDGGMMMNVDARARRLPDP